MVPAIGRLQHLSRYSQLYVRVIVGSYRKQIVEDTRDIKSLLLCNPQHTSLTTYKLATAEKQTTKHRKQLSEKPRCAIIPCTPQRALAEIN